MEAALNHRIFLLRFAILMILSGTFVYFLHSFGAFVAFRKAGFILLAGFSAYSLTLYLASVKLAADRNPYLFTRLTMMSSFAKMFLTVILLLLSDWLLPPDKIYFFVTYIVLYIVFAIFEGGFLTRIAKSTGGRA